MNVNLYTRIRIALSENSELTKGSSAGIAFKLRSIRPDFESESFAEMCDIVQMTQASRGDKNENIQ